MRILVTGASGYVGRGLLPALAAEGHQGVATGRSKPAGLPIGWEAERRESILESPGRCGHFDVIVHREVRQHVVRPRAADIVDFNRVNVDGGRAWAEWATANGTGHFVFLSSIKVAGAGSGRRLESDPDPLDTPYGQSKVAGEEIVRRWAAQSVRPATILRSAPVYGPGNKANIAAFVRQIARGRPYFVGAGIAHKSIVARRNLVAAIAFSLQRSPVTAETFNVSDAKTLTVKELAELIASLGSFLGHEAYQRYSPSSLRRSVTAFSRSLDETGRSRLHGFERSRRNRIFPATGGLWPPA